MLTEKHFICYNDLMKNCPFKDIQCTSECGLYVSVNELNEMVANRLRALGVLTGEEGMCSLKNIALVQNRHIFENTVVYRNN